MFILTNVTPTLGQVQAKILCPNPTPMGIEPFPYGIATVQNNPGTKKRLELGIGFQRSTTQSTGYINI
jgi:hypothetical protein